ncbi:MAG: translation initiation factor IF-2 [Candidatus Hydrogenedentes bacterium]|nr:translation initiation factor IF-2 [Candidatus Hydrogenedentota bacterium]
MQTISSLSKRLDMSPDWAVEVLQKLRHPVTGADSEIDADEEELLISLDEDPDLLEKMLAKLAKEDAAREKKAQAEAKKKAAAAKKAAAKKPAAKKPAAKTKDGEAGEQEESESAEAEEAPGEAEPAETVTVEPVTAAAVEVAEEAVLVAAPEAPEAPEIPAETPVAAVVVEEPAAVAAEVLPEEEAQTPAAPHHPQPIAVILTDEDLPQLGVAVTDGAESGEEDAADKKPMGKLEAAEHQHEVAERKKSAKKAAPAAPLATPDPDVVAAVIAKDRARREMLSRPPRERVSGPPRPGGAVPPRDGAPARTPGGYKGAAAPTTIDFVGGDEAGAGRGRAPVRRAGATGKTAKKKQKQAERMRLIEENVRREAAIAVKEFQSGASVLGAKKRRKRRHEDGGFDDDERQIFGSVVIEETITVDQLAIQMGKTATDVILELMGMDIMATKNQVLELDVVRQIADKFGFEVEVSIPEEEQPFADEADKPEDLITRPPVVTVMGHVDHGKTSLLDRVRATNVAEGEAGGITQHIAAYQMELPTGNVTFLDTPGHEAFTQMRARGAHVTDLVVLVVAATDGVKPQTVEAIDHAKAAEVPIVVAINKCDMENAQPDRVRQELTQYGLLDEAWGGKTIMKNISARTGDGVDDLMELLGLQAEMMNLRANPSKRARGAVVESEITTGQGPVAWVLVQSGTLRVGDAFLAGVTHGRVRSMTNARGEDIHEAGPSMPVVVTGFSAPPDAGDIFIVTPDERIARGVAEKRAAAARLKRGPVAKRMTLEDFHARVSGSERKTLQIVVKADVQGSVDVLQSSFAKLGNEEVSISIVHAGVGAVNESDVMLASASDAVVIGFHVTANAKVQKLAEQEGVEIRTYRIIYEAMDELKNALEGMLTPDKKEVVVGHIEVRRVFRSSALGNIAGCYVQDGEAHRGGTVRLVRDGVIVYEGKLDSIRREKDDVRSISAGFECGVKLDRFDDVQVGDIIEVYRVEQVAKTLE